MLSAKNNLSRLVEGKVLDLIPNFICHEHRDADDLIVQLSTVHLLISVRLSCLLRSLYPELAGETSPTVGFWWGILDSGVRMSANLFVALNRGCPFRVWARLFYYSKPVFNFFPVVHFIVYGKTLPTRFDTIEHISNFVIVA